MFRVEGEVKSEKQKTLLLSEQGFRKFVSSYTYQVWFRVACSGCVWVQVLRTYIATSQPSALRLSLESGFWVLDIRLCGDSKIEKIAVY